MGYTGLMMALLIVCDGSRQIRTLAGFVSEAGCSRTTIFEIQGLGLLTRINCPVLTSLSKASLIVGSLGTA